MYFCEKIKSFLNENRPHGLYRPFPPLPPLLEVKALLHMSVTGLLIILVLLLLLCWPRSAGRTLTGPGIYCLIVGRCHSYYWTHPTTQEGAILRTCGSACSCSVRGRSPRSQDDPAHSVRTYFSTYLSTSREKHAFLRRRWNPKIRTAHAPQ